MRSDFLVASKRFVKIVNYCAPGLARVSTDADYNDV